MSSGSHEAAGKYKPATRLAEINDFDSGSLDW